MKIRIVLLVVFQYIVFTACGQQQKLPENFLGFGWIVGFGYDRAFFPSDRSNRLPTVEDFFRQKEKYGIRMNEEQNAYEALQHSAIVKIKRSSKADTVYITPVLATYKIYKIESLKPYNEMLQVISYKGRVDSIFYRFGIDFDLQLKVLK